MIYTTKTLADAVGVSINTVKGHLHGAYQPLRTVGVNVGGRWYFDEAGKEWYKSLSPHLKPGKRAEGWFSDLLADYPPPPKPTTFKEES